MDARHPPVVSLCNLTKAYDNAPPAIRDINLDLRKGEVVVLLGPSGVGKSTLLRCINLLTRPSSGGVWVNGEDLAGLSRRNLFRARQKIGMIFQEFHLIDRLSVITNVMCGRLGELSLARALTYSFPQAYREAAERALVRVGLDDPQLWARRADRLSGGQKQRVAIARALMQTPSVLLADEPIASLDIAMRLQIIELLADLARRDGITVIVSLHQIDITRQYADRVIALSGGHVTFDAPPSALSDMEVARIFNIREKADACRSSLQ